ncbi:MAG: phospholipase A [Burkholderiales bacterium]|nr:phospholipase A [Burkholderiales bacterium]
MLPSLARLLTLSALLAPALAHAQSGTGWQACSGIADAAQRLACFDRWAASQAPAEPSVPATAAVPAPAAPVAAPTTAPASVAAAPQPATSAPRVPPARLRLTQRDGCREARFTELTRFWELEPDADCGTFGLRVFHPISLDLVKGDRVNRQPTSEHDTNNAASPVGYDTAETRVQLSIRTKLAGNLFTRDRPGASDSIWFAYTQQSYWQVFSPQISRPFRSTDHEPELIYVMPLQSARPGAWRLRLGGLGVVHQSNGQSLPLSRSWNRIYLLGGAERGPWELQARLWKRIPESAANDDNPHISDYIGRAEARLAWRESRENLLAATWRHSLRRDARGSLRLEWFRALSDDGQGGTGGLQLHTQLFSGYGDSLLDYNFRRTVFSVGLALVDW